MRATVGILGVGSLASFIVEGLCRAQAPFDILLSPQSSEAAEGLAERFGVGLGADNQDIVARSDLVFVSLPAQDGRGILADLQFRKDQSVLSAMAGTSLTQLQPIVAPAQAHVTMMPGAANALGCGPCLLLPFAEDCQALLSALGPVVALETEEQFDIAAVFGGFSGASFAWMNEVLTWFQQRGLPSDVAQNLVAATLRGNAEVVLQPGETLERITKGVATPGGVTWQLVDHLNADNALQAWQDALEAVYQRMKAD